MEENEVKRIIREERKKEEKERKKREFREKHGSDVIGVTSSD